MDHTVTPKSTDEKVESEVKVEKAITQCEFTPSAGPRKGRQCTRNGRIVVEGKTICSQHNPKSVARRAECRRERMARKKANALDTTHKKTKVLDVVKVTAQDSDSDSETTAD